MTRIYTDDNGVYTNAIVAQGESNVEGHVYYTTYGKDSQLVSFQRGPVNGKPNGVTNENLLAILKHRLNYLNKQVQSEYNDKALFHITMALAALEQRTADRKKRNVEGTYVR